MRLVSNLAMALVVGFGAFLAFVAMIVGVVVLMAAGLLSAVFLLIALFAAIDFAWTHDAHAGGLALGFLLYASIPFIVASVLASFVPVPSMRARVTHPAATGRRTRRLAAACLQKSVATNGSARAGQPVAEAGTPLRTP